MSKTESGLSCQYPPCTPAVLPEASPAHPESTQLPGPLRTTSQVSLKSTHFSASRPSPPNQATVSDLNSHTAQVLLPPLPKKPFSSCDNPLLLKTLQSFGYTLGSPVLWPCPGTFLTTSSLTLLTCSPSNSKYPHRGPVFALTTSIRHFQLHEHSPHLADLLSQSAVPT